MKQKSYRIGIDTGGTFTDAVVISSEGEITMAKAATTPQDFSTGVMNVIDEAARALGMDRRGFLSRTTLVEHGSTVATNALITRRGVRVGFITTRGFEDTTLIMRAIGRTDGLSDEEIRHVTQVTKPKPLVPRKLIRGVSERIDYLGEILVNLNRSEVEEAVADLVEKEGCQAIAVSLLNAWINPEHERKIKGLCQERYGSDKLFFSFGSELTQVAGEYARANTAILNAFVGPIVQRYLDDLESKLRAEGFGGSFLVMQGNGGTARKEHTTPIANFQSGPAGGIMASAHMAQLLGHRNVITTDMGGTSFDVGLITEGLWRYAEEPIVERFRTLLPIIFIDSIGAGGGTIARVDEVTGRLLVGPDSAGASPGPVCYDAGGEEVTVTDADVALGIIDPAYFLGGRKALNAEKARDRLTEKIATPMHMDTVEAAAGIYDIVSSKMADLIRRQMIRQGHLPEEFVLYAFGGAGPVHAAAYASEMGVKKVFIFNTSAVFSAFGIAVSDVVHTRLLTCQLIMPVEPETLNDMIRSREAELTQVMADEGFPQEVSFRRFFSMRYRRQMAGCEIPIPWESFSSREVSELQTLFERKYEELYGAGAGYAKAGIEICGMRFDAVGAVPKMSLAPQPPRGADASHALKGQRTVYFTKPTLHPLLASIYEYGQLECGNTFDGPAIVEAPFTTVVVPPGCRATVDAYSNLVIDVG